MWNLLRAVARWTGEALGLVLSGEETDRQRRGSPRDRQIPEQNRAGRAETRGPGGTIYHPRSRPGEPRDPDGYRDPDAGGRDGCRGSGEGGRDGYRGSDEGGRDSYRGPVEAVGGQPAGRPTSAPARTRDRSIEPHGETDPRRHDEAGDRRPVDWGPPVVGRPTADFEARPSSAAVYRPDCLADGWATNQFTVRLASVRGYEHRYSGTPRQDDAAIAHHAGTGAVLFAVADGVSGAPLSHIGSSAACRAAISAMTAALDGPEQRVDWPALVRQAAWQLCEQTKISLRLPEVDQRLADEKMATTLVAGLVLPTPDGPAVQLIQVGDSSAWILNRQGRFHCLLPTKFRPGQEVVSSATAALPRVPPVEVRRGTLADDDILLVGTDGFGDPLGDGEGAVGRHFADALGAIPPVLKFANDLDFSRETWDDDRTLFALWPRRRRSRSA